MPANASVKQGDTRRFKGLGQLDNFRAGGAALNQVNGRNAVHHNKVIADSRFNFTDNLQWHAHTVFVAAAPLVAAVVSALNQHLVEQVTLRGHHFNTVVTGLFSQCSTVGKVFDNLLDLVTAQNMRRTGIDARGNVGGTHRLGDFRIAAGVQ